MRPFFKARDITKEDPASIFRDLGIGGAVDEQVDVLVGGPPCQAFARVGRAKLRAEAHRREEGDADIAFLVDGRVNLWQRYLHYVRETKPVALLFERFSLELHAEKTRLLEFGRFAAPNRKRRGLGKPETFTFLGFIFICGKSRHGAFQLQRRSRGDRMRATLQEVKAQLRKRMHDPIPSQGRWLRSVVQGYFAYHAVPTNMRAIGAFRYHVTDLWLRTLRRRSQKDAMTWKRMTQLAEDWLPPPRILHQWPDQRFDVKYPRWEPSA